MPWWAWLAITAAFAILAAVSGYAVLRRSSRGREFLALRNRQKLRFARALLADRATPLPVRALLAFLIAYILLPFDIIPDFIPVAGQMDDLAVVIVVFVLVLLLVQEEQIDAAMVAARGDGREPVA